MATPLYIYICIYLAIRHNDEHYPVARHFKELHGQNETLLTFVVLDVVKQQERGGDRERQLRIMESKYIIDFETLSPVGLNSSEELAIHLG